ncbi:UNVERIFIED_CONTAM: hypothetical protein PYX00_005733 [Menopon gallinae]|uniref:Anti-proliferative protein domain-containing protein n=1 Tax=Menopon gallinae TaxID=328185 RepID=A0AAW2HTD0_9NEOP
MHIEVQVALNFVISYLYNKLPRRRVNIFGEELEKALKDKFQGHWYPDKPFKGSAYRCLKIDPVDAILDRAARESGVPIQDILENLPQELAIWVDPGEVSYRIGEKGAVKILFSDSDDVQDDNSADREVTKTFNPEAQCFRPIETVGTSLGGLSLVPTTKSTSPFGSQQLSSALPNALSSHAGSSASTASARSSPTPTPFKSSPSPVPAFIPRSTAPLTFTTATFAQTKFGSTKLKTSSKRANRMSPTEFSNYIKQRAMQQQIHHQHPVQTTASGRALSPNTQGHQGPPDNFYFPPGHAHFQPQFTQRNVFDNSQYMPDVYNKFSGWDHLHPPFVPPQQNQQNMSFNNSSNTTGINNFGLGTPYAASQYQHLLMAN